VQAGNEDGKCENVAGNWDLCNSHFRCLVVGPVCFVAKRRKS